MRDLRVPHFTLETLKEHIEYNPATGIIYRKMANGRLKESGTKDANGYVQLSVDGFRTYAHRLIWFYTHGYWPGCEIDHVNRVHDDNRLANLRLANNSQQKANEGLRSTNTSGYKGVSWCSRKKKWQATITFQGRREHLGYSDIAEDMHAVYCKRAAELFGERHHTGLEGLVWSTPIVTEVSDAEARLIRAQVDLQEAQEALDRERAAQALALGGDSHQKAPE